MVIKVLAPSQLTVTIDRKAFPNASLISYSTFRVSEQSDTRVAPDQSIITLKDLGPGTYSIVLYGKRNVQKENGNDLYAIRVIARKQVEIKEGHDEAVSLAEADRFEPSFPRAKGKASEPTGKKGNE